MTRYAGEHFRSVPVENHRELRFAAHRITKSPLNSAHKKAGPASTAITILLTQLRCSATFPDASACWGPEPICVPPHPANSVSFSPINPKISVTLGPKSPTAADRARARSPACGAAGGTPYQSFCASLLWQQ